MSLYVAICCDSYHALKLTSLYRIVAYCGGYTLADGSKLTRETAKRELKSGSIWLYEFDEYQQEELSNNGFVRGAETICRIQKI